VLGVLVDLVFHKGILAGYYQTHDTFAERLLEPNDAIRVRPAVIRDHQMFFLFIQKPDASFIGPDASKGLLQELSRHFVTDAEEIRGRDGLADFRKMFLERGAQRD